MNLSPDGRRGSTGDRLKPGPCLDGPITFEYQIQHHTTRMQKLSKAFKVYRLTVTTLICLAAGLVIGLLGRTYVGELSERHFMYMEIPGELYLRFLKLMIIPLLVSNVILSFGSIQGRLSSKLGTVASSLYVSSNLTAIAIAIVLALIVGPGDKFVHKDISRQVNPMSGLGNDYISREYYDSIKRYRQYHPMFYHSSDRHEQKEKAFLVTHTNPPAKIIVMQDSTIASFSDDVQDNQQALETFALSIRDMFDSQLSQSSRVNTTQSKHGKVRSPKVRHGSLYSSQQLGLNTKLPIDVLLDFLRNLIPDNIVEATMKQTTTRLFAPRELIIHKNGSTEPAPSQWSMGHEMVNQANIVGLLAISVMTGVLLSKMEEASKPFLDLCACISELSLRINMIAINLTPFCITSLLIGQLTRSRDLSLMAGELFMYFITVMMALMVHALVVLPMAYYFFTRKSPLKFCTGMFEALVASFATSSSSATMALMLNCLTELDLNPVIVRAFGPLGSVFNMNGTAIYEAIATIFIAQTLGVTLPFTSLLLVGICSAVASLSTSGIPSSGMMTIVIVLNSINLPVLQLSVIYIVDFIIDRFRTVVNVWSGAIICGVINQLCPEHLFEEDKRSEAYLEMVKQSARRATLGSRKSVSDEAVKPQIISVTITPPPESSDM